MQWRTHLGGVCADQQSYRFVYDAANRLKSGDHFYNNGTSWVGDAKYYEGSITYDLNGNIKSLVRFGNVSASYVDNLAYFYGDTYRPDRLTKVTDSGNATKGFKPNPPTSGDHYLYDAAGNMTSDGSATWTYNDDGDGCTRGGSKTFALAGPNPVIKNSGFTPPGAASRSMAIPGLLANAISTVAGLSYDWRCVATDGTVTSGTTPVGTDLDIHVVFNDPLRINTSSGLFIGGTEAQSGAGSSASGSWFLQGADH